jgi:hypothetical protein
VLGDHVQQVVLGAEVEHRDDVRVLHTCLGAGLLQEPMANVGVDAGVPHLDHAGAVQRDVGGMVAAAGCSTR